MLRGEWNGPQFTVPNHCVIWTLHSLAYRRVEPFSVLAMPHVMCTHKMPLRVQHLIAGCFLLLASIWGSKLTTLQDLLGLALEIVLWRLRGWVHVGPSFGSASPLNGAAAFCSRLHKRLHTPRQYHQSFWKLSHPAYVWSISCGRIWY